MLNLFIYKSIHHIPGSKNIHKLSSARLNSPLGHYGISKEPIILHEQTDIRILMALSFGREYGPNTGIYLQSASAGDTELTNDDKDDDWGDGWWWVLLWRGSRRRNAMGLTHLDTRHRVIFQATSPEGLRSHDNHLTIVNIWSDHLRGCQFSRHYVAVPFCFASSIVIICRRGLRFNFIGRCQILFINILQTKRRCIMWRSMDEYVLHLQDRSIIVSTRRSAIHLGLYIILAQSESIGLPYLTKSQWQFRRWAKRVNTLIYVRYELSNVQCFFQFLYSNLSFKHESYETTKEFLCLRKDLRQNATNVFASVCL